MTSIAATSKLIPATGTPRGSGLRCTITIQVNDKGLVPVNGQAVGFGEDGEGDGWVSAYEHFALALSNLRRHQVRRSWSSARRARREGTAGD